jgi:hypothetical protein
MEILIFRGAHKPFNRKIIAYIYQIIDRFAMLAMTMVIRDFLDSPFNHSTVRRIVFKYSVSGQNMLVGWSKGWVYLPIIEAFLFASAKAPNTIF